MSSHRGDPGATRPAGDAGDGGGARYAAFLAASATVVFVLVLLRFTPQFALWRGLDAHAGWFTPELNRAAQTLRQIADPWTAVENDVNAVINWRLLFPLAAHYLHLPTPLFLALPAIGCLLTLVLLAHVFARELARPGLAVAATALMATTSWFFTSTGWLAYFDSWYVGGLVLAAFVDARWVLALTCLLAPWVDERFVLGLPLALVIRAVRRDARGAGGWQAAWRDVLACAAALAPLVAVRGGALLRGSDGGSIAYVRRYLLAGEHFPDDATTFLTGSWHGLRAAWLPVAAFAVLVASSPPRARALVAVATLLATVVLALFTAADVSRSMSILLPAAVMGVVLVARRTPGLAAGLLAGLLAVNLAAPAAHVTTYFTQPIDHVFAALEQAAHPPDFLDPRALNRAGAAHFAQGNLQDAFYAFDSAVILDPRFAEARHNRGRAAQELGDLRLAREDFSTALALMPADSPSRPHTAQRLREVEAALAEAPPPPVGAAQSDR